ncbi:MAG: hypothetical protein JXA82_06400 [Sedimentisphaerales bacterium]|nr:hypothetical protein [Sedimentisphaerales bacterium]
MSEDPQTTKRFRLRIWHVLAGLVILCLTVFVIFILTGNNQLEAKIAELQQKGYPTSYDELIEQRQLPEDIPNAADTYIKAFMAYQKPSAELKSLLPIIGGAPLPELGQPLPEEMKTAIDQFLQQNKKCLDLLHQAAQIDQCYFQPNMTAQPWPANPNLNFMKSSALLLKIAAIDAAVNNNYKMAEQYVLDGQQLVKSLDRGFFLIDYLVQAALEAVNVSSFEYVLNYVRFTDELLQRMDLALEESIPTLDASRAFTSEACTLIQLCNNPDHFRSQFPSSTPLRYSGLLSRNVLVYLEYIEKVNEVLKLPPWEQLAGFKKINAEISNLSFLYALVRITYPAHDRIHVLNLRMRGQINSARVAIAMERYRLAEGKLPEALEELVPLYLDEVPLDPFDGKPLRYKQTNPGYIIYSIGEDQVNNGGIPLSESNRDSFDWPFTIRR